MAGARMLVWLVNIGSVAWALASVPIAYAKDTAPRLIECRRIWDAAPHNAFTDLVRFHDEWLCVFREGQEHVSPDGALRVIGSRDGQQWVSLARLTADDADLRDAKLVVTPTGELMLSGAGAWHDRTHHTHQSFAWFSSDGRTWSPRAAIGDPDFWLWRTTWVGDRALSIGYGCRDSNQFVRLYTSRDGRQFDTLVPTLHATGYPNESSIVFAPNHTAFCLLRRDAAGANGLLGRATPPYTEWSWQDLGQPLGGPHMLQLPDGRLLGAMRLYRDHVRTSLCWIDPTAGSMTECLELPSGGDTSYPGMVLHEGQLWVSYYSSHEGKTSIYLARVALN